MKHPPIPPKSRLSEVEMFLPQLFSPFLKVVITAQVALHGVSCRLEAEASGCFLCWVNDKQAN